MKGASACDECLARAWLLDRLSGHLDTVRANIHETLELSNQELIEAVAGGRADVLRREYREIDFGQLHESSTRATAICRCSSRYPRRLLDCPAPPAVLYVAGNLERYEELCHTEPVAVIGARRPSSYGLEVARSLGRGLAAAGLPVLSGMALGIDSAAHSGALDAPGSTAAVLPGGLERPYPSSKRRLYERIAAAGVVISELPPATAVRRWMFPARNRIIAALAEMTVVVEGGERSGSLITARRARELGRPVGAVPGRVTSALAAGPHRLLSGGARLVTGVQDVLDALFGIGVRTAPDGFRPALDPELDVLLGAIGRGHDTLAALTRAGVGANDGLAGLSALELAGYVRRGPGGRYVVVP